MSDLHIYIGNKNYSSWSLRAWLAVRATGTDFQETVIPLDRPETAQQIVAHSPSGRVPAIIHHGFTVWESLAIGEYLADAFPAAMLWPEGREVRALARAVACEMHAGFGPLREHMPMDVRNRLPGVGRGPGVQDDIDRIVALWADCRSRYGGDGPFLFGHFSIADAMYAPVVSRLVTYEVDLDEQASAYRDAVWNLASMQEWIAAAETEPWEIDQTLPLEEG